MLDPETIRHRIIEHRRMRLGDVLPNPRNWKDHPESQGEALDGLLEEVGWLGSPIAYHSKRLGGALTWADGNLRGARYPDLVDDVDIADLTDAEADLILLTYDPIAAMAHANAEKLDAVLRDAESGNAAVMALVAQVAAGAGLYKQVEEDDGRSSPLPPMEMLGDGDTAIRVIIVFADEQEHAVFLEMFGQQQSKNAVIYRWADLHGK